MENTLPFGVGVTTFAVDPALDRENIEKVMRKVNSLKLPGEDRFIEVLVTPDFKDLKLAEHIGKIAGNEGYGVTICGFRPGGNPDMLSETPEDVDAAVNQMYNIINVAEAAGAKVIAGPWHRDHMNTNPTDVRKLVGPLTRVADRAADKGIYLALEMLVSFEMYGCNSVATTLPIVQEVDNDYLGVHYDMAHASRQESSVIAGVVQAYHSGKLHHVHVSEAGRGPIGDGPVSRELVPFLQTLGAMKYDKVVSVEVFHPALWGAVQREDKVGIMGWSESMKNSLALKEAKSSFVYFNGAYATAANNLATK